MNTYLHTYLCLTLSLPFCFLFTAHFVNTTEIKLRSKNCLELRALSLSISLQRTSFSVTEREHASSITGNPVVNGIEYSSTK